MCSWLNAPSSAPSVPELSDEAVVEAVNSFLDCITAAFTEFADVAEGTLSASDLRSRSLLGSVGMLRVLAGTFHALSAKDIAESITSFFPGISIDDHIAVIDRYRNAGAPIWADSTEIDMGGITKLQEVMVSGGVLPADKKVAYGVIVTKDYSNKAQELVAKT